MTSPAWVREPEVLAEQMAALCAESKRTASEFALGALDALQWLTQGGPGPLTMDVAQLPVTVRAVVHELAAAEAATYGRQPSRREYARGVEHALMWAQYATAAPPAPLESSVRRVGLAGRFLVIRPAPCVQLGCRDRRGMGPSGPPPRGKGGTQPGRI